jgi:hypothetical protein
VKQSLWRIRHDQIFRRMVALRYVWLFIAPCPACAPSKRRPRPGEIPILGQKFKAFLMRVQNSYGRYTVVANPLCPNSDHYGGAHSLCGLRRQPVHITRGSKVPPALLSQPHHGSAPTPNRGYGRQVVIASAITPKFVGAQIPPEQCAALGQVGPKAGGR